MRFLALACALSCACSFASKEIQTADSVREAEAVVTQHTETGPVLDLEFGPPENGAPLRPDGLPAHGPLLRARVQGPSTSDLVAVARAQAKEHEEVRKDSSAKPALSCAFASWLWAGAVIAVAALAFRVLRRSS